MLGAAVRTCIDMCGDRCAVGILIARPQAIGKMTDAAVQRNVDVLSIRRIVVAIGIVTVPHQSGSAAVYQSFQAVAVIVGRAIG